MDNSNTTVLVNSFADQINARRVGNTTRLLDKTIQILFSGKKCYVECHNELELKKFFDSLNNRFIKEHSATATVFDSKTKWANTYAPYRLVFKAINTRDKNALRGITIKTRFKDDDRLDTFIIPNSGLGLIELQTKKEYEIEQLNK